MRAPDQVRGNLLGDCSLNTFDEVVHTEQVTIVQDAAKVENVKAMTDFTREYGVY